MQGFIHPSALLLHFSQDALSFPLECGGIHGSVVIVSDEGGSGSQVIQDGFASPQSGEGHPGGMAVGVCFLPQDGAVLLHAVAQGEYGIPIPAHLGSYTGHARATKAVKDHVPRIGVVEQVAHDGFVRNLGVVSVSFVNGVIFPLAHISGKRLPMVGLSRCFLCLCPLRNEIRRPRIGAGSVIGRVAQVQNVLVRTDGESLRLAELRILQVLPQLLRKVLPPCLIALKLLP